MKIHDTGVAILASALAVLGLATGSGPAAAQGASITLRPADNWVARLQTAPPGAVMVFEPGRYRVPDIGEQRRRIRLRGAPDAPITLRSARPRAAVLDGAGQRTVLHLVDSTDVVIEGFTITNPSPDKIDGRREYRNAPGRRHFEGVVVTGAWSNVVLRGNLFRDIATRGVLAGCRGETACSGLLVEGNLFTHVGHDTASGDVNITGGRSHIVRGNLLAGSVDGVVFAGRTGGGHLVERNLCLGGRTEDCLDLKGVNVDGSGTPTRIRANVIRADANSYTGITVQNETNAVEISGNLVSGGGRGPLLWLHGRSDGPYMGDGVRGIAVHDNLFAGKVVAAIRASLAADRGANHRPVRLAEIEIRDNAFKDVGRPLAGCCSIRDRDSARRPAAALVARFEALERAILADLCGKFSGAEIRTAIAESAAARKGYDTGRLGGICEAR